MLLAHSGMREIPTLWGIT